MELKDLRARGAFVAAPPVPTEVTWVHEDPETGEEMTDTFTVFVRRMSVGWLDRVTTARADSQRSFRAALISEAVLFGENGQESLTYDEAHQLDPGLATVLISAFNQLNAKRSAGVPKS
jgi:hypothetical protein